MIGYYLHHVGTGHLHRALAVVPHLDGPVTALSSRPRDDRWPGEWVELPRDDEDADPRDPTASGALHWAPLNSPGYRRRMAVLAEWIDVHRPSVMVVDLSVEVLSLARLMGVPVVAVTLPGVRDDAAHQLGYDLADAIVAPWPDWLPELGPSLGPHHAKVTHVGAISRYEHHPHTPVIKESDTKRVLALSGTGGGAATAGAAPAGWEWTSLGPANWDPDPWARIRAADVVVTHAGLGALADVAVARRAAVVLPQERPHAEQATTAAALGAAGLAVVPDRTPESAGEWRELVEHAQGLGGDGWSRWADGSGGRRMAAVVAETARRLA